MKYRKVLLILVLVISIFCIGTIEVNAKSMFSSDDAEDELSSDEAWIEQLSSENGNNVKKGPEKVTNDSYEFNIESELTKNEPIWFHIYYEKIGLKDSATVHIESESVEAKFKNMDGEYGKVTYDNSGNNSMEFILKIVPKKSGNVSFHIILSDSKGTRRTIGVELKNIEKTAVEKEIELLEEGYKNTNLINGTPEELALFIESDMKYNEGKNLKKWTKAEIETRLKKLNLNFRSEEARTKYAPAINALDKILEEMNNAEKEEREVNDKVINEIITEAGKQVETKVTKLIMQIATDSGTERGDVTFVDVLDNVNNYIPLDTITTSDAKKLTDKVSIILTIITNIGIILSVLMLAFIGIKYMLGSVEEKAEYKKDMVPYLVGAILLFGITTIIKVLQEIGTSINNI